MNQINYQLLKQMHALKPVIRAEVLGASHYLPPLRVRSTDIMDDINTERHYGLSSDWMDRTMGIEERRMVALDQRPSDLAIAAARRLLDKNSSVSLRDIGALIFCGIERDRAEPATAHTIQKALGTNADHVFDVANACFGFFDGTKLAASLIESGMVDCALVVTGEVSTKMARAVISQLKTPVPVEKAKHLLGMLSVGDAGGAMLIGASNNVNKGFVKFHQVSKSQHVDLCHYEWKANGDVEAHMNMAQIVARGLKLNKRLYQETLEDLGWKSVDWAIAHQTGKTAFEHALNLHGLDEHKLVKTYPKLGNITSATMPVCFDKLLDSAKLKPGDKVGGLFAGSGLVAGQFGYQY